MEKIFLFIYMFFLIIGCNSDNQVKHKQQVIKTPKPVIKSGNKLEDKISSNLNLNDSILKQYEIGYYSMDDKNSKYYFKEVSVDGQYFKYTKDFIESDSILIKGVLFNNCSEIELLKEMGQADSILDFTDEMYGFIGKHYYYPDIQFVSHDFDSVVRFDNIDFKSKEISIKIGSVFLNSETELEDIKEIFPLSYLNAEWNRKHIGKNNSTMVTDWLRFNTIQETETDDQFILVFHNRKLRYIWYWVPS